MTEWVKIHQPEYVIQIRHYFDRHYNAGVPVLLSYGLGYVPNLPGHNWHCSAGFRSDPQTVRPNAGGQTNLGSQHFESILFWFWTFYCNGIHR